MCHLVVMTAISQLLIHFPSHSLFFFFVVSLGDDVDAADFDGPDEVLVAQYTHAQVSLPFPTAEFASSGAASTIPRILEHGDFGDVPESHCICKRNLAKILRL